MLINMYFVLLYVYLSNICYMFYKLAHNCYQMNTELSTRSFLSFGLKERRAQEHKE